jgi:hypothetical protein
MMWSRAPQPIVPSRQRRPRRRRRHRDPPITWNGITLYGTIDIGIAYLSHGAPLRPTYGAGLPFNLSSYSNHPLTSLAPNGLSQSKIGLSGVEPLGVR